MKFYRGKSLRLLVRGASHAPCIEFRLSGLPIDFSVDDRKLAAFMKRRAPGRDRLSTSRRESDFVNWVVPGHSGYILNENVRPGDYGEERTVPRPGHADWPQYVRYGRIPTGGGSNSGRMTAAFCAAGGCCLLFLESRGISVAAKIVRCGDIAKAKKEGDSVGGVIECEVRGVPVGLGGAMLDGLDGEISVAMFGIPGVKGIEFGNGFSAADLHGSENNDAFGVKNGEVITKTNRHGGILGGFSSGMPIVFRVAMKPTPTIFKEQDSVDLATLEQVKLSMKGRHDPCIVRRAVPVVEAMAAMTIADALLANDRQTRICLTLTGKTLEEDLAQYESQKFFTDMVELRVDLLECEKVEKIVKFAKRIRVPVILTCRRKRDGGAWKGGERQRAELLRRLISLGSAAVGARRITDFCPVTESYAPCPQGASKRAVFEYVDLESDFHACDKICREAGVKIVRSLHVFDDKVDWDRMGSIKVADGEILKLAIKGKDISDGVKLLEKFVDCDIDHVVMQMGCEGFFTRALAGYSRSKWVYTSVGGLSELGHVSPEELVRDFRFRDVNVATQQVALFGVTGWPLKKTRSPELHNAAFFAEDIPALMVPMPCGDIRKALDAMKTLEMRGLAVTIPHKETILPLLDEIDETAKAVGAVNTVLCDDEGKLRGYNTDVAGFTRAFLDFVIENRAPSRTEPRIALLGAGGAAKACRYAIKKLGCKVTVFHRKPLVGKFDVIVNATPVDPIPDYVFRGDELVFDLRYVPETTDLMSRAAAAGCKVCNGFAMLRHQAEEQRRIWLKG